LRRRAAHHQHIEDRVTITWTRTDTVAAIVALVLVFCALPTFLVGSFLVHMLADPRACKSPPYEPALITAYATEPLLTAGVTSLPTDQPEIRHFCDLVGTDHIHNLSYTEVTYRYPASAWRAVPELLAAYQPSGAAEGWVYSGNRNDSDIAAIEFCKAVQGTSTTLTIAMLAANIGGATVEARQIVSVPGDQDCPFQSDLWGRATSRPTKVTSEMPSGRTALKLRRAGTAAATLWATSGPSQ
jgi:hypothetical protein